MKKARAVFVSRNFPPVSGGMERLNYHGYLALRQVFDLSVSGPEGARAYLLGGDACRENPTLPLFNFLVHCQWNTLKMALATRPELVFSGSGLTAPAALLAGRVVKAEVVCYLHGLDIVADQWIYKSIFVPAIRKCDLLLVNSQSTAALAGKAGVCSDRVKVVYPGVTIPDWRQRDLARAEFREAFNVGTRRVLLSVGRLTERKGLAQFIREALPGIVHAVPDVLFLIIGEEPTFALKHKKGTLQEISEAVIATRLEAHVRILGSVGDDVLSEAYFAADLLVFPVLELPGDVEGFGMVATEAAAHGLATVAFSVGGVAEAVADNVSGRLVPPGDYEGMVEAIVQSIERPSGEWASSCFAHAQNFTWERFSERLLSAVQ